LPVVIVATTGLAALPGNVTVPARLGLRADDSVVNVTQLGTVDRLLLDEQIGELPDSLLTQVDAGLQ
jgi:mRNA interferase MazF